MEVEDLTGRRQQIMEKHDDLGIINGEKSEIKISEREETLYGVLYRLIARIVFPDPNSSDGSTPLLKRAKISLTENCSPLREASKQTGQNILLWTRSGSPLRALLVISVSTKHTRDLLYIYLC